MLRGSSARVTVCLDRIPNRTVQPGGNWLVKLNRIALKPLASTQLSKLRRARAQELGPGTVELVAERTCSARVPLGTDTSHRLGGGRPGDAAAKPRPVIRGGVPNDVSI